MKIRIVEDVVVDGRLRRAGEVVETDAETVKFLIYIRKAAVDLTPDSEGRAEPRPYGYGNGRGGKKGRKRVKRAGIEAETTAVEAPEER
jgi:hypothetical protein